MSRSIYLFVMTNTIDSASASNAWSCLWSSVLAAARCARSAAALTSLSARSFPYTSTCAGTCRNSTWISDSARVCNTRFMTCHRSVFSRFCHRLVHPSVSHRGSHLLMPSIQSLLSLWITRVRSSVGQVIAFRIASMIVVSSARFTVCLPGGIALML